MIVLMNYGSVVLLTDGTVGRADHPANVGDTVTVHLQDEALNSIVRTGAVKAVLAFGKSAAPTALEERGARHA